MIRLLPLFLGSAAAVTLVVLGLCAWGEAPRVLAYSDAARPEVTGLALRAAAVALVAAGQVVLWAALGRVLPRRAFDRVAMAAFGSAAAVGTVCTVALALVGR